MEKHKKLIEDLIWATNRMNEALVNKNISVVEEMIQRRDVLLQEYSELQDFTLDDSDKENIAQMLKQDKDNNVLLEAMVDKERQKIIKASKKKNDVKKKTTAVKKYVYGGASASEFSRFNKKT